MPASSDPRPLIRRDVVTLTGITENQFKVFDSKDQFPVRDHVDGDSFEIIDQYHEDGSISPVQMSRKNYPWANKFSAEDVFRIALFVALWRGNGSVKGLSPLAAKVIVMNNAAALFEALTRTGGEDIWLGYVWSPDDASGFAGGFNVSGPLGEILPKLSAPDSFGIRPTAVVLTNVSEVVRQVFQRAKKAGIILHPAKAG